MVICSIPELKKLSQGVFLTAPLTPPSCEEEEEGGMRRQKRGVLPKHATAIMKAWLFQHIVVRYST